MLLKNYKKITDGKKKKKITDDIEREESLSDSYIFSGSYWYSLPMHAANISIALRSNVFNTLCHQYAHLSFFTDYLMTHLEFSRNDFNL